MPTTKCAAPWYAPWRDPHEWLGYANNGDGFTDRGLRGHHWGCKNCGLHHYETWAGGTTCGIQYCPYNHSNPVPWANRYD